MGSVFHVRIEVVGDKKNAEYVWDLDESSLVERFVKPWMGDTDLVVSGRRLRGAFIKRLQVFTSDGGRSDLEDAWNARATAAARNGILTLRNDAECWIKMAEDITDNFLAKITAASARGERAAPNPPKPSAKKQSKAPIKKAAAGAPKTDGSKRAFLVAVEKYQDPSINGVAFARSDANELAQTLERHGFKCSVFLDEQATKTALESQLKKAVKSLVAGDTFYFFYAGHGFSRSNRNYLTCFDVQRSDAANTSLSIQRIFKLLNESPCTRAVLFLDACHTGWTADDSMRTLLDDLSEAELEKFFRDAQYCIGFSACRTDEQSRSSKKLKHGIWTYHLIQAFGGHAPDAIVRGRYVTDGSLLNYLRTEVPKVVKGEVPSADQNPTQFGNRESEFMLVDLQLATPSPTPTPTQSVTSSLPAQRAAAQRWVVHDIGAPVVAHQPYALKLLSRTPFPKGASRTIEVHPASAPDRLIASTELRRACEGIHVRLPRSTLFPFNYGDATSKVLAEGVVWDFPGNVRRQFAVGFDGSLAYREEFWEEKLPPEPPFRIGNELGGVTLAAQTVRAVSYMRELRKSFSRDIGQFRTRIVLDGVTGKRLYVDSANTTQIAPLTSSRSCHEKLVEVIASCEADISPEEVLGMAGKMIEQIGALFDAPQLCGEIMSRAAAELGPSS